MKILFIKFALLLFPLVCFTDVTAWKVKSSAITFKIKNAGVTVDGSFTGLKADIRFDPLKPQESSITATVDSRTLNTEMESRDRHTRKPEFLSVDAFPLITLQSTRIEKTGPITFVGTFKLTLKGVTKEITMPFTFMKLPDKTEFKGSFTINRRDYGIGGGSMILSEEATVTIVADVTE